MTDAKTIEEEAVAELRADAEKHRAGAAAPQLLRSEYGLLLRILAELKDMRADALRRPANTPDTRSRDEAARR